MYKRQFHIRPVGEFLIRNLISPADGLNDAGAGCIGRVRLTADTLKNTRDFDRVMRGYKSRNTYTVSGTVGGF